MNTPIFFIKTSEIELPKVELPKDSAECETYFLSIAVEGAGDASLSYGTYEVSPHVAAVVTNSDGEIVAVRFDCAQTKFNFNEDGSLVEIDRVTTKVELKEAYGEMPAGTWYVQAQAFENHVIGMTKEDVEAIDVSAATVHGGAIAGCTMVGTTPVFKALVLKALAYEHKVEFTTKEDLTVGVAIDANLAAAEGGAQFNANYAAVVFAGDEVAASILDETQTTLSIAGKVVEVSTFKGSKNDQGEAYGQMPAGTWYKQATGYCTTTVGKTAADLANLDAAPSDALTEAGCTMKNVAGYKAVIIRAAGYAR